MSMPQKWEYGSAVHPGMMQPKDLVQMLNKLGQDHWECFQIERSVAQDKDGKQTQVTVVWVKRRISSLVSATEISKGEMVQ